MRMDNPRHRERLCESDMCNADEYLTVHWQSGVEKIHRSRLHEFRKATKEESAKAAKSGALPSLKALETIEGMDHLETLTAERRRTIRGVNGNSEVWTT